MTFTCNDYLSCSEYSTQLNASRIKVLQAQDDIVTALKDATSKELLRVSQDKNGYKKLLKGLIVQVRAFKYFMVFFSLPNLKVQWDIYN